MWIRDLGIMFTSFAFLFRKEQYVKRKKAAQHIFLHVYLVRICNYISAKFVSRWILRALQVSRPDPWAHIRVPCQAIHNIYDI